MQIKQHIPNTLTLTNLFCGCTAILILLTGTPSEDYWIIAALMMGALVADFGDGMAARVLKAASPIGKELDSLADMVTFGVLPGFLLYTMFADNYAGDGLYVPGLFALLVPLFSALRLAKFNIDERQSDRFFGLPTPANAILVLSLFLIFMRDQEAWYWDLLNNQFVLIGISFVCSLLLVLDVPLLALKFKNLSFKDNAFRFILIGLSIVLSVILSYKAVPLIILFYFFLSLLENRKSKS